MPGIVDRMKQDLHILQQAKAVAEARLQQLGMPVAHEMRLVQLIGDLETEITCLAQDLAAELGEAEATEEPVPF